MLNCDAYGYIVYLSAQTLLNRRVCMSIGLVRNIILLSNKIPRNYGIVPRAQVHALDLAYFEV